MRLGSDRPPRSGRRVGSARLAAILACLLLLPAAPSSAQSGGGYDLAWSSVDCGAEAWSAGGPYALRGTAGQPDAGLLAGGDYALTGGFWSAGIFGQRIFLPAVLHDD